MSSIPPGYKMSEVGIIPEDWDVKHLRELAMNVGDGIHSTPNYLASSEFFFINGNNLSSGKIVITEDTRCISEGEYFRLRQNLSHKTILMSINGTIGNLAFFVDERVVLGKSAAYISLVNHIDKSYIYYCLQSTSTSRYYKNELTGTTIRNLSLKSIRETPIPLPPLHEQQAIAAALSDVDDRITALDTLIAKKRELKQGAMQRLLTGQERLPGFSGEWQVKRLGEVLRYEQPSQYLVQSTEYHDTGTPVLTAGKTFILGYTGEAFGIYSNLPVIVFDDFTIASRYVNFPFKVKSSAIKLLTTKDEDTSLWFVSELMCILTHPIGEHKRYYISEYQYKEVAMPCYEEQQAIATVLSDMDAEISTLEAEREKTAALKQGMMQELLTGRTRLV